MELCNEGACAVLLLRVVISHWGIDVVGSCVQSFTEDIQMYINSTHLNLLKVGF